MKTLFVVGGLPFGGIENLLFDISSELLKRNYPFKVVNLSGTGQKVREFEEAGIPLINLGNSFRDIKTFKLGTARRLKELIEREDAQIVHSMQFTGDYFTRLALLFDKRRKVITHIHNTKIEKRFERRLFNKMLSLRTDVFLSVSKEVFEVVEKTHNFFKKPHYIFYNGIAFRKLEEQLKGAKAHEFFKGRKVFIALGRLVKQKRIDLAIRAISMVANKHPDVALAVIGDGGERERLKKLAEELKVEDRVYFFGYQKEVAPFLSNAFALVMPSEYEGLPITHLEAAYFGLPAIISPFVPSKEILSQASLIAPLSAEEVAKKMELLLENEKLYKEMSQKARETAKRYSIERYADALLALYERLIKGDLPKERVLF